MTATLDVPRHVGALDPAIEKCELIRPTLHCRRHTTVAVLRDRLYFCGGMEAVTDSALGSVESYDPGTDSWEESTPVLDARSGAKVARVSGCLYVIGGATRNAHGGFSFFEVG